MDPIGLKLRRLRKLNRESIERRTSPNIAKIYEGNHIVRNLEDVFAEIERWRRTRYYVPDWENPPEHRR